MAFETKQELDDYVKNNPNATCEGISTGKLVKFIDSNKDTYCFLKEADLGDADLEGADLSGDYLVGACFDDDPEICEMYKKEGILTFEVKRNLIKTL